MVTKPRKVKRVISELTLDRAFADQLATSRDFQVWLLERTKFRGFSKVAKLLHKEQVAAKPRKKPENWWRHWWCRLDNGSESETDIFLTFEVPETSHRFAIHIEDKPPHGKFTPNQYLNYKPRAICMANSTKYMNYSDFTTVLLAPAQFLETHSVEADHFDCQISYESISPLIPLFGDALAEATSEQGRRPLA